MSYCYLVLATAINNWDVLKSDSTARRAFGTSWACLALFGASLAADYL
jgi:hypothetical protein